MKRRIADFRELTEALGELDAFLRGISATERALFDSRLVAMELLANELEHGGGRAEFSFCREGEALRICVRGERDFCPPEKSVCPDGSAERGRGLFLVDALAKERTYSPEEGITVLIELD